MPATIEGRHAPGRFRLGVPPLEYLANVITGNEDKEVKTPSVGFEVDLCTAVAKKLGLKLGFVTTSWSDLPASLDEGKVDIVAVGHDHQPRAARAARRHRHLPRRRPGHLHQRRTPAGR